MVQTEYRFKTRLASALVLAAALTFTLALAASGLKSADPEPLEHCRKLLKDQSLASPVKTALLESMPVRVRCMSFATSDNQITLTGTADNYRDVQQFVKNLEASKYFEEVAVKKAFNAPRGVQFTLHTRCLWCDP